MRPWGTHPPVVQNRARCFERSGSDFSPLVDAFHPSFPASVEVYISQPYEQSRKDPTHKRSGNATNCLDSCLCLKNASVKGYSADNHCASDTHPYHADTHGDNPLLGTSGPLFKLPWEVSDLILSYLSPAALNAARHTCKDYRTRILSNTWVSSSVLGVKEKRSPSDGSLAK